MSNAKLYENCNHENKLKQYEDFGTPLEEMKTGRVDQAWYQEKSENLGVVAVSLLDKSYFYIFKKKSVPVSNITGKLINGFS